MSRQARHSDRVMVGVYLSSICLVIGLDSAHRTGHRGGSGTQTRCRLVKPHLRTRHPRQRQPTRGVNWGAMKIKARTKCENLALTASSGIRSRLDCQAACCKVQGVCVAVPCGRDQFRLDSGLNSRPIRSSSTWTSIANWGRSANVFMARIRSSWALTHAQAGKATSGI